jgi:predicted DNA-binding transcriptional regulator YafY
MSDGSIRHKSLEVILEMMRILTQTRTGETVESLSVLLDLHRRSVYRYLKTIEDVGIPMNKVAAPDPRTGGPAYGYGILYSIPKSGMREFFGF